MQITIKFLASLEVDRPKDQTYKFPPETKVKHAIEKLELPRDHFGMILLNGQYADLELVLNEGDVLSLLPLVDGG